MAISLVQTKAAVGADYVQSLAVALTSSVTAGNLLVLFVGASDSATITVSDSRSNTWTKIAELAGQYKFGQLWYSKNVAGGATTITINNNGDWLDTTAIAREYSGLDTSAPLDVHAEAYSNSYATSHSSGATGTTSQADALVVGAIVTSDKTPEYSAGSGYGNLVSRAGDDLYTSSAMEDKTVSSTGAQTATFGTTEDVQNVTFCAVFKEAGGGEPPATVVKDVIGVGIVPFAR